MINRFQHELDESGLELRRKKTRVLQLNIGRKCNQTCVHCHVNAGPNRKEMMSRETMERVLSWLAATDITVVDITGGAPELNPHFRFLVEECRSMKRHVMDRCNLTVLFEVGQETTAEYLTENHVEIVASLPCYDFQNVDTQRGDGVFEKSIAALQVLNQLGYGREPQLPLHLVYNPIGPTLAPPQTVLEAQYKKKLMARFGIVFNNLFCLNNLPIARFENHLKLSGELEAYSLLLEQSFNSCAVDGLMCRDTISVGWTGEVYDCDFNQMLNMQWRNRAPLYLWHIDKQLIENREIATGNHCFGCTAGAGSSCGGALV